MGTLYEKLQEREDSVPPRATGASRPRRFQRLRAGHERPFESRFAWARARNRGA